jgi:hypothetical protein
MERANERPGATLDKILARAREGIRKVEKMSADVAARREPEPAPIHRLKKHTDPTVKSSQQSEVSESSGSSATVLATISKEDENKPGRRPDTRPTKIDSSREAPSKDSLDINPESEEPYIPELAGEISGAMNQRELQKGQLCHEKVGKTEKHKILPSSGQGACWAASSKEIVSDVEQPAQPPVKPQEEEHTKSIKWKGRSGGKYARG